MSKIHCGHSKIVPQKCFDTDLDMFSSFAVVLEHVEGKLLGHVQDRLEGHFAFSREMHLKIST